VAFLQTLLQITLQEHQGLPLKRAKLEAICVLQRPLEVARATFDIDLASFHTLV